MPGGAAGHTTAGAQGLSGGSDARSASLKRTISAWQEGQALGPSWSCMGQGPPTGIVIVMQVPGVGRRP